MFFLVDTINGMLGLVTSSIARDACGKIAVFVLFFLFPQKDVAFFGVTSLFFFWFWFIAVSDSSNFGIPLNLDIDINHLHAVCLCIECPNQNNNRNQLIYVVL
jgi:hypothetical protein